MAQLPFDVQHINYKMLIENPFIGIITADNHGNFLYVNSTFCIMLGYKEEELLQLNLRQITHEEDRISNNLLVEKILGGEISSFQTQNRYLTKQNQPVWLEVTMSSNRNKNGDVEYMVGIITDINKRKESDRVLMESEEHFRLAIEDLREKNEKFASLNEEYESLNEELTERNERIQSLYTELEESEEKYKLAFRTSPDSINITKIDGVYVDINDGFTEVTGYTREDVIGVSSLELNIWARPEDRVKLIEGLKKTGIVENLESVFRSKDGSLITALMSARFIKINGELHILSITRDITERKNIEEALKQSEEIFNSFMEYSPVFVFFKDVQSRAIRLSRNYEQLFGMTIENALGKTMDELFPSELSKSMVDDDLTVIRDGKAIKVIENLNGRIFETTKFPIVKDGKTSALAGFTIDITDRKKAEEELIKAKEKAEESDRLKSAFLANMSHEIRTPMNAIKGFAQLLEEENLPHKKRCKYSKIINQRTDDLLTLINDLLDIAKIEAGQLTIVEKPEDLNNLFDEIFQFFKTQQEYVDPKPITLKFINELTNVQSLISADFFRLRQILINLVNNALKFTSVGYVIFGCRLQDNKTLLFYVEDSGIGIPEDKYALVFEPFRQINESYLSKNFGGTGLGLSIVKGLVELMKGKIWIESQPQLGTKIFFTIPYMPTNIISSHTEKRNDGIYNWDEKTIMIVEDDEFNAQLIIEFIAKTKVKFIHAIDGNQAIEFVKSNQHIDLILMDIQLPDINGYELTRMLKGISPLSKIIAQTAYAAEGDKNRAFDCGCDDYISKPIERQKFLKLIHKHLDGVR